MKKLVLTACLGACVLAGQAKESAPLWLRNNSISPDGTTIAFTYKGNIFTVPVTGGSAKQITTHTAYDTKPIWSPDGSKIVFASDREGSMDLFIVDSNGGSARRLTTHTSAEYPEAFLNDEQILFSSNIQPTAQTSQFPSGVFSQIYVTDINGKRPAVYSGHTMEEISVNPSNGTLLFTDKKGYEDKWRKHQQSSIARDIWTFDPLTQKFDKKTNFKGEDRNAIWGPDNKTIYYLSEQDGTSNIYKLVSGETQPTQLTFHKDHPVRFLSVGKNGLLSYSYDGELYTLKEGGKPEKVNISITDDIDPQSTFKNLTGGASAMSVSPNGKEIAFINNGELFVTATDYSTTKRLTNTAVQERNVEFSPDGRSIYFSSERNGKWNIYKVFLPNKDDKYFTYATEVKEEPVTSNDTASFQPRISPDGKEIAYLEDRTAIKVLNLENGKTRTVLDKKYNYSYTDGDQYFEWSPDGKWILAKYISVGGWNNTDIALIKADGSGEIHNLTQSGYSDATPQFVMNGKAIMWSSDRAGYRSHGSWGAFRDLYLMFLDEEAFDTFKLSKEDLQLVEEAAKNDSTSNKKKKQKKEDLVFDTVNAQDRIIRLTPSSGSIGDAVLLPKGDKLYYISNGDLIERDLKSGSSKELIKGFGWGSIYPDKDYANIYALAGGSLKKVSIPSGAVTNIAYNAEFNHKPFEERQYIYDHAWQQVADKFYDPTIHGIDWKGYHEAYNKFLPYINNNYDFAELLSEILGELNASHTGARYRAWSNTPATASLGIFIDENYQGDGLRISEIIPQGPLSKAALKMEPGMLIEEIDGTPIKSGMDYYPLLQGKSGKQIVLSIYDPKTKKNRYEKVKPFSYGEQNNLLYKRWVKSRRALVDSLSNGRIGYVHIKGMDSESFRTVYSELLGLNRQKEAVIVDTRHNGGGWLHDDLVTLLGGKLYQKFVPRGQYIGDDPFNKWTKPSVVLMCEDNYSNAHGFPFVYKELGIGKLIGAPVPGTMTAVWWENQIDPSLVFGIPQVGVQDLRGKYLENQELQPDIEVYNSPESQLRGDDEQIKSAVNELLRQLENNQK
ncbi:MAG: S41 family peptidase [Bacteroidales bacterium]